MFVIKIFLFTAATLSSLAASKGAVPDFGWMDPCEAQHVRDEFIDQPMHCKHEDTEEEAWECICQNKALLHRLGGGVNWFCGQGDPGLRGWANGMSRHCQRWRSRSADDLFKWGLAGTPWQW